jgi:FixJ family two-component response regulator
MKISSLFDNPTVRAMIDHEETTAAERIGRLTQRERQILLMITDGLLNKQTAAGLGISQRTVENHRQRLIEKTGVRNFAELVRLTILAGVTRH